MQIPVIRGLIKRRLLVNYRVDPEVLTPLLPAPFRPKLANGYGMVGICLIRLENVRPRPLPTWMGAASENVAHRAAVEWDESGQVREGVYIRRRDTTSRLNVSTGGRIFPGIHHHAHFQTAEKANRIEIKVHSADGETAIHVAGSKTNAWPSNSVFDSIELASKFFQNGSLGYSATPQEGRFQGLELNCHAWQVEALEPEQVSSSLYDDNAIFPKGSIELDCILLMRNIEHEWHGKADLCCQAN